MILARVVGTVVATRKDPRLEGKKLLILKPVSPDGKDEAGYVVAVDTVSAGCPRDASSPSPAVRAAWPRAARTRRSTPRSSASSTKCRWISAHDIFGRVIGAVWATVKNRDMEGCRLLVVQPLTPDLKPTGRRIVVTDSMGAGAGELVYWVARQGGQLSLSPAEPPFDPHDCGNC